MFRIGIDFDNTIACYEQAFLEVAASLDIVIDPGVYGKSDVKRCIVDQPNGEFKWQRLQGKVYGKYMSLARCYAGVQEFIYLARERGHQVFIVSHKSEFGHFDEELVPLRVQAISWLNQFGFLGEPNHLISYDQVFFESTRAEKIARVCKLNCTHFIDDLLEVFDAPGFPSDIIKILFTPHQPEYAANGIQGVSSWRGITSRLLGTWTDDEMCAALQREVHDIKITNISRLGGRGNSRIYRLSGDDEKLYILKCYPDRQLDKRPRMQTEFLASQTLFRLGFPVPEPIFFDTQFDWGLYENIPGGEADPDENFIENAATFLEKIYEARRSTEQFSDFGLASEACLSGEEIISQLKRRLDKLSIVRAPLLEKFIDEDFIPLLLMASASAKRITGEKFVEILAKAHQVPSPSDFGAHNAILTPEQKIFFIDFEYFGWDDPVKLVSDFYWHPAMMLSDALRARWLIRCIQIFGNDYFFALRLKAYLPLFGLRWCLILLNEFLPTGLERRGYANSSGLSSPAEILKYQLSKAKRMLQLVKQLPP